MTLLRWALCSLQSFSASSQVCLWVKYLQDGEWRHKSNAFFIYYASRRLKVYWVLQWVNQELLRAVKNSDADGWSTCGRRDLHLFYLHFSITPTCSSVRGTSSSRARSLLRLPRRREERERLEGPDLNACMNEIQVCLSGRMQWNKPARKPCYLLFQAPISFCVRTQKRGPKLAKCNYKTVCPV